MRSVSEFALRKSSTDSKKSAKKPKAAKKRARRRPAPISDSSDLDSSDESTIAEGNAVESIKLGKQFRNNVTNRSSGASK